MRSLFISITLCLSVSLIAQRSSQGLFAVDANHRNNGFLIGLGATQLFAQSDFERDFLAIPDAIDAGSYRGNFDPDGKLGFHLELGMFWITERSFFDYVDLNLGYSQHKGVEAMTAEKLPGALDTLPNLLAGNGDFAQDILSLNLNFNKAIPIKDHWYGLAALGLDLGYRIIDNNSYDLVHPSLVSTSSSDAFAAHAHAKLGVGYKTSSSSWLSLTAETPIETFVPFDGLTSRKTVFNSKYRPVTFTLRYQWLRKRPARECPTGPKPSKKKKRKKSSGKGMKDGQLH